VSTSAQHERDQAIAKVSRLQKELLAELTANTVLAEVERVEAMDKLIGAAEELLSTEVVAEQAERRLVRERLEARHAAVQRSAVQFAAAPVLVAMVAGALVLFEAIAPLWLVPAIPLFAAGLRIAFGQVRCTEDAIRARKRATAAGVGAAALTALALIPWPSAPASVVLVVLAVLAVTGTVALLVSENRVPGESA
jgi:hypothetical protein